MLHIHNGDCSANTAIHSSVQGEHFAWREELIEGPTPSGHDGASWRSIRAQHLSRSYALDLDECERGLLDQENKLASFQEHEEVALWFEHDLFCQVHLLYLLNWFAQRDLRKTTLSLICVGQFPGKSNFRGLGELNAKELASLFPGRTPVSGEQLEIATLAWEAYCSPDPIKIEKLLQTNTSSLPFLKPALQAHLRRFPSTKNGLGAIENKGLELINGGLNSFVDLFSDLSATEQQYGLGDAQFWLALRRMNVGRQPLIAIENGSKGRNNEKSLTSDILRNARLQITKPGKSVLKGEDDFVALNGIDLWLGGVHLLGQDKLWRWDQQARTIVLK